LIKIAMIRVDQALAETYPEAKLILQVHDELIIECPEEIAAEVAALVLGGVTDVDRSMPFSVR